MSRTGPARGEPTVGDAAALWSLDARRLGARSVQHLGYIAATPAPSSLPPRAGPRRVRLRRVRGRVPLLGVQRVPPRVRGTGRRRGVPAPPVRAARADPRRRWRGGGARELDGGAATRRSRGQRRDGGGRARGAPHLAPGDQLEGARIVVRVQLGRLDRSRRTPDPVRRRARLVDRRPVRDLRAATARADRRGHRCGVRGGVQHPDRRRPVRHRRGRRRRGARRRAPGDDRSSDRDRDHPRGARAGAAVRRAPVPDRFGLGAAPAPPARSCRGSGQRRVHAGAAHGRARVRPVAGPQTRACGDRRRARRADRLRAAGRHRQRVRGGVADPRLSRDGRLPRRAARREDRRHDVVGGLRQPRGRVHAVARDRCGVGGSRARCDRRHRAAARTSARSAATHSSAWPRSPLGRRTHR